MTSARDNATGGTERVECDRCGKEVPKDEAAVKRGPGFGVVTYYCSTPCGLGLDEDPFTGGENNVE